MPKAGMESESSSHAGSVLLSVLAIVCIASLEFLAIRHGIDGVALSVAVAAIAGIVGVKVGSKLK